MRKRQTIFDTLYRRFYRKNGESFFQELNFDFQTSDTKKSSILVDFNYIPFNNPTNVRVQTLVENCKFPMGCTEQEYKDAATFILNGDKFKAEILRLSLIRKYN